MIQGIWTMAREPSASVRSGERVERSRQLRRRMGQIVAGAVGLILGVLLMLRYEGTSLSFSSEVAIAIAVTYVALMVVLNIVHHRITDEFEIQQSYKAANGGGFVLMLVYPAWWILWLGNVAPEPDHELVFLAFCSGVGCAYLYNRLR